MQRDTWVTSVAGLMCSKSGAGAAPQKPLERRKSPLAQRLQSITKHIQILNGMQANDHAQAQDDLENIVARTKLSMSACTKPTNDFN